MVRILIILSALLPATAWAKEKGGAPRARYFYAVSTAESAEWPYQVPECRKLEAKKYAALKKAKKCGALNAAAETCESGETAVLENAADRRKERFPLNYIVFASLEACRSDREAHLQGEE